MCRVYQPVAVCLVSLPVLNEVTQYAAVVQGYGPDPVKDFTLDSVTVPAQYVSYKSCCVVMI